MAACAKHWVAAGGTALGTGTADFGWTGAPSRVLDAPDLLDDYYLNLTSWGANNCVAVALGPAHRWLSGRLQGSVAPHRVV